MIFGRGRALTLYLFYHIIIVLEICYQISKGKMKMGLNSLSKKGLQVVFPESESAALASLAMCACWRVQCCFATEEM